MLVYHTHHNKNVKNEGKIAKNTYKSRNKRKNGVIGVKASGKDRQKNLN